VNFTIPSQKRRIFQSCLFSAGILLSCSLAGSPLRPQLPPYLPRADGQSAISVKTELVALPVRVTDANGSVVSGLSSQNFQVYEDGRLQRVTFFQQGDTPVTVALVVDHSRSMGPELPEVAAAVSTFAHSSNPQDEMFVVDFNDAVSVELLGGKPFTNDPNELEEAVSAVSARGKTALYDAIAEGLLHLQLGHCDRKALIIISDGGDNASQHKFSEVLALAQQSQVLIYSVALVGDDEEVNPAVLRKLSKATGGIVYSPDRTNTVTSISTRIARDLREQYTLGFAPEKMDNPHAFRKIEVKVVVPGRRGLHVQTRPGYVLGVEKTALAPAAKDAR
jgi:Ca-activated chloride channel family protein